MFADTTFARKSMRRWLTMLLALGALVPRRADAQDPLHLDSLRPGVRVRFHAPAVAPDRFVGTIRWLSADSIALDAPDHRLITVPRAPITTMEISGGTSRMRAARRGLMWGVPIGAAIGALLSATVQHPRAPIDAPQCPCSNSDRTSAIIVFTALGGVFGGGFGAANPSERWLSIPVR